MSLNTTSNSAAIPSTLPAVAKNFHTHCKKCDTGRYHKVLAHVDAMTAKLECEVCHKKSTYSIKLAVSTNKSSSGGILAKAAKSKASKKTGSGKSPSVADEWQDIQKKIKEADAKPYKLGDTFSASSTIRHTQFGLGYVKTADPSKITVIFESGTKSLVHNRT